MRFVAEVVGHNCITANTKRSLEKSLCVLQFVCVNTFKFHFLNCVNIELFMKFKFFEAYCMCVIVTSFL